MTLVVLLLVSGGGLQATAFATGDVGRNTAVDVATDLDGAYGIDNASAVHTNSTEPLVNVTNDLGRNVTVTVELRSDSTDRGDLVIDGTNYGDSVSFDLTRGATETVDVSVPADGALVGTSIYFHVRASAPGLQVSAEDRSVPIEG